MQQKNSGPPILIDAKELQKETKDSWFKQTYVLEPYS